MKKLLLILLCLFPLFASAASVQVEATATEPTTRTDGSLLDNLSEVTFLYSLDGDTWEQLATIPASSPSGGGQAIATGTVIVPDNQQTTLQVTATATDVNGLTSDYATAAQVVLNLIRPSPPSGVEIQVNIILQ